MFDGRGGTHENAASMKAAEAHAAEGGQGLHVWDPGEDGWPGAPLVFLRSRPWAHLFDNDHDRLVATAKALGVRVVKVGRKGRKDQHIDLCASPLRAAMAMCDSNPDAQPRIIL